MNQNYNPQHVYDLCKNHMQSYVLIEVDDGTQIDGIITGLDGEHVYLAVPIAGNRVESSYDDYDERQFGYGYPGYGYGGYPGYGYRPRRFNRLVLPLAALTALSVLPWY